MSKNRIGLDIEKTEELIELLKHLLANYSIFYQNARGYHWNIKGTGFFELHTKFEELYNDLFLKIDEVAERILTLGGLPENTFSDYMEISKISEKKNVSNGRKAIEQIVDALTLLIEIQRGILDAASSMGDEGTGAQMSDYIREQEKLLWMYGAYLS